MQFQIQANRIFHEDESGKLLAEITFPEMETGICTITHTFVDDSLRGQGIAGKLVQEALKQIIRQGKNFSAECSYAKHWIATHSDKTVTVLKIFDEDYGCEGMPENEEPMCRVLLQDVNSNEKWLKLPDRWLTEQNMQEGDKIEAFFLLL